MASRSAAEKDGWCPRLGRGGGARALSCGGDMGATGAPAAGAVCTLQPVLVERRTVVVKWTCREEGGNSIGGGWFGGGAFVRG